MSAFGEPQTGRDVGRYMGVTMREAAEGQADQYAKGVAEQNKPMGIRIE